MDEGIDIFSYIVYTRHMGSRVRRTLERIRCAALSPRPYWGFQDKIAEGPTTQHQHLLSVLKPAGTSREVVTTRTPDTRRTRAQPLLAIRCIVKLGPSHLFDQNSIKNIMTRFHYLATDKIAQIPNTPGVSVHGVCRVSLKSDPSQVWF